MKVEFGFGKLTRWQALSVIAKITKDKGTAFADRLIQAGYIDRVLDNGFIIEYENENSAIREFLKELEKNFERIS